MEIFGAGQQEGGFFIMVGRKAGGADRDLGDAERAWERLSVGETNVVT